MSQFDFLRPTERGLEFGAQYARVLARWGELFSAAAALVEANVALGRMTNEASREFEAWLRQTAAAPWSWLGPEMVERFMESFGGTTGRQETPNA